VSEFVAVMTTTDDEKVAEKICRTLVEERLAACAQVIKGIKSFYWWEGKVEESEEFLIFLKTKAQLLPRLEERLKRLHNYSVPEIVALPFVSGSREYFDWMLENLI